MNTFELFLSQPFFLAMFASSCSHCLIFHGTITRKAYPHLLAQSLHGCISWRVNWSDAQTYQPTQESINVEAIWNEGETKRKWNKTTRDLATKIDKKNQLTWVFWELLALPCQQEFCVLNIQAFEHHSYVCQYVGLDPCVHESICVCNIQVFRLQATQQTF